MSTFNFYQGPGNFKYVRIPNLPASSTSAPSYYNPVPVAQVLQGGIASIAYSETISVQGGSAPYSFTTSSGSVPTGLTLNSSTGVISGTPTVPGTFPFTVKVTDANAYAGQQAFSISIATLIVSNGNSDYVF